MSITTVKSSSHSHNNTSFSEKIHHSQDNNLNQNEKALIANTRKFNTLSTGFTDFFANSTHSNIDKAQQYLNGLILSNKKNMERMSEIVPDTDEQKLQHFISNSSWSARDVMDRVAQYADAEIGAHPNTCLIIDESGIPKKGKASVGVARQY